MTTADLRHAAPGTCRAGHTLVTPWPAGPAPCQPAAAGVCADRQVQRRGRWATSLQAPRGLLGGLLLALVFLLANLPGRVHAGTVPGELPGYVGRLSTVAGDVRWYDRDSERWLGTPQQPLRNWPLAAGDRLRTGADGRAELRVGSTTLRLGADTDLSLQRLDGQGLVLWLESGSLAVRLSAVGPAALYGAAGGPGWDAQTEVMTADGRWLPQSPGHYRIDRQPSARTPASQGTAWRGELRFEGRDSALSIPAGRRADLWRDSGGGPTRFAWAPVERDGFADWVARDERLDDAPVSARYVPAGVTGWQELDRYGDWVGHPEFGRIWQPREVASGWAPFHDGRWAWVAPWGWTWIDAAPWGFAPFHYGSWVVWQDRWCWSPGPRQGHPHYVPALSSWVAAPLGPSLNIGINIGQRPPPPRVVIPVPVPPRMVVAPPQIVVLLPPPPAQRFERLPPSLAGRGEPGRGPAPWHQDADRRDGPDRAERHDRHDRREGSDRGRAGSVAGAAPDLQPSPRAAGPGSVGPQPRQVQVGAAPMGPPQRPIPPMAAPVAAPVAAPAAAPTPAPAPVNTPATTALPATRTIAPLPPAPQPREAGARQDHREARAPREARDEHRPAETARNEGPQRTERIDRNTAVR